MNSLFLSSKLCVLFLGLVYNLPLLCSAASSNATLYKSCGTAFSCGTNLSKIGYPFWGGARPRDCGYPGLELTCRDTNVTIIKIMGHQYQVLGINENDQTINILREDLSSDGICPRELVNTTLDFSLFDYTDSINITILYGCPSLGYGYVYDPTQITCSLKGSNMTNGYVMYGSVGPSVKGCYKSVVVPVMGSFAADFQAGNLGVEGLIAKGFVVKYNVETQVCKECTSTDGRCGYDASANRTTCICAHGNAGFASCRYNETTGYSSTNAKVVAGHKDKKPIIIGISIGAVALLALLSGCCLIFARRRRNQLIAQQKSRGIYPNQGSLSNGGAPLVQTPWSNGLTSSQDFTSTPSTNLSQSMPSYGSSKPGIGTEKTNYFGAHVFTYDELEHATSNFHDSKELGDGGFGTVYYGVLPDGRQVAVKRLYEHSAKRVDQFMNEIEILAGIHHKNLVALYGCSSKRERELLLVYEYVPNGTVADHIHGRLAESTFVPWLTRLSIAIQTAEALAFLHRNVVIHRDVKTANILLDNDFHVKVADFGLSRSFPLGMTHVSTAPQGTPGYVDPEYYQCYKLTEKSDVYSFGVVLIELISSKHAVDITRHRHHVNLANMALDRIQNQELHELVDPRLGFDKDHLVQSMVKMVAELGFRCLQQDRDMRPTMDEVLTSLIAIQLEGLKAQKQEVVDIRVYGDDVGLLTNPTPPLSPELPRSNDVV